MGAIIIAGFVAYLVVALVAILIARGARNRLIVAALFVLVPMGDHWVGLVHFKALCAKDAGQHIYKKVSGVEGLAEDERPNVNYVKGYGYRYIEGVESRGGKKNTYVRYQRNPENNEITRMDIQRLTSRYIYDPSHQYKKYALSGYFTYYYQESVIRDVVEEITLAKQARIVYSGGWVARYLIGGSGGKCEGDRIDVVSFVRSVLQPIDDGTGGMR